MATYVDSEEQRRLLTNSNVSVTICALVPIKANVSPEFVDKHLGSDPNYGWWRLPVNQSNQVLSEIRGQLFNKSLLPPPPSTNLSIGYASAKDGMQFMYNATRVHGVWENIPEVFQGVFWMKGNGIAEELTVLQYGQWFHDEQTLLVPMAPFNWGWPGGIPADAPFGGGMYKPWVVNGGVHVLLGKGIPSAPPTSFSYTFGDTGLKDGNLQVHRGDITVPNTNIKTMLPFLPDFAKYGTARFTLEEEEVNGAKWKRGIKWGIGQCRCIPFGGYELVKVVKPNGEPNEPYYSEFLKYMGEVPLFFWTGFA